MRCRALTRFRGEGLRSLGAIWPGRRPGMGRLDLDAAPHRDAVVQHQLLGVGQCAAEEIEQRRDRDAEQRRKGVGLERSEGQADLELPAAVGRDEAPLGREHRDAFDQRAQELGAGVEVDADRLREDVGEHVVLDHLRRHAHQGQRVLVEAAVVAGHVERADHLAIGIEDGRGGAGEELVGVQVVLAAVHRERLFFGQRGADGVGAHRNFIQQMWGGGLSFIF